VGYPQFAEVGGAGSVRSATPWTRGARSRCWPQPVRGQLTSQCHEQPVPTAATRPEVAGRLAVEGGCPSTSARGRTRCATSRRPCDLPPRTRPRHRAAPTDLTGAHDLATLPCPCAHQALSDPIAAIRASASTTNSIRGPARAVRQAGAPRHVTGAQMPCRSRCISPGVMADHQAQNSHRGRTSRSDERPADGGDSCSRSLRP
jgi:hypothetical protein